MVASTWDGLVAAFLDSRRERAAAPRTLAGYRADLASFWAWHQSRRHGSDEDPAPVTAMALAEYRQWLVDRYKPSTANKRLATLRTMFGWATGAGLAERNPARNVRPLPTVLLGPRGLGRQELTRLVDAAGRHSCRDAVLTVLLAHTGLRISEALGLTWGDVRLGPDWGTIIVRHGKGQTYREVPLNASARRALSVWRTLQGQEHTDASPLFPGQNRRALVRQSAERALVRASRLAGIDPPATPLTLRHTFCKALVDAGESLDRVAALAGHASVWTTARYTLPTRADLLRAVERLDSEQ